MCRIIENEKYCMKILLYSFHLNGNTRPKMNKTKKKSKMLNIPKKVAGPSKEKQGHVKQLIAYFFRSLIMTFGDIFLLFNSSSS